jgi:hypothetical protein
MHPVFLASATERKGSRGIKGTLKGTAGSKTSSPTHGQFDRTRVGLGSSARTGLGTRKGNSVVQLFYHCVEMRFVKVLRKK